MTLFELLKYHAGEEQISLRRMLWNKWMFIRCYEEGGFMEHCVKNEDVDFACPWFPWVEDILADDWEEACLKS